MDREANANPQFLKIIHKLMATVINTTDINVNPKYD